MGLSTPLRRRPWEAANRHARALLAAPAVPLAEVALASGLGGLSGRPRAFVREVRVTTSEYCQLVT